LFEQYLLDVQPDPEAREVLQMLMGLCLVPDTRYNVFILLHGRGGEGKSVFLHILVSLVGAANVCHVPFSKFGDKFSIGLLTEHLLNLIGEGDTELPRDAGLGRIEGVLKDACDGGLMPVEHKFQEPGQARATARCIAASNSLPAFYDRSEAIWDRLRVIPFNERIRGTAKEDPRLRERIVNDELPGILNFAVAGLAKLRKLTRFPETPAGAAMKAEHRARCDHEREFLMEHYAEGGDADAVATQALYREYRSWMSERSYHAQGEGNFGGSVQRVFPRVRRGKPRIDNKQVHAWMGLKKKEDTV
jgi:P4 family phage/plasmid primase-like protien